MVAKLKRCASRGFCLAGVLAAGTVGVGTSVPSHAGAFAAAETPVAALTDDGHEHAPAVRKHVDSVAKSYLVVQKLLAQDKLKGISAELKKIREAANALAETGEGEVAEQATTIAKHADMQPKDLKAARAGFKPLSSAVIGLVNLVPPSATVAPVLYEATCPMAKANWLQATKEIYNPYMGREMLNCGSVERKVEPATGDKENNVQAAAEARSGAGSCCVSAAAVSSSGRTPAACH